MAGQPPRIFRPQEVEIASRLKDPFRQETDGVKIACDRWLKDVPAVEPNVPSGQHINCTIVPNNRHVREARLSALGARRQKSWVLVPVAVVLVTLWQAPLKPELFLVAFAGKPFPAEDPPQFAQESLFGVSYVRQNV